MNIGRKIWILGPLMGMALGCASAPEAPIITKDHRITKASERLDEWLHNHCHYVGIKQGKDLAHDWVNQSEVNFLELIDSRTDFRQVIAGFHCKEFPLENL